MLSSSFFQQAADTHRRWRPEPDRDVPVPNHVPWYYLVLAILIGAALLSHGVAALARAWEKELGLPEWFSVAGQAFGIVLATGLSCFAGYLVWNWALGGMVGLIGSVSSQLVLSLVRARIGATQDSLKEALKEETKK